MGHANGGFKLKQWKNKINSVSRGVCVCVWGGGLKMLVTCIKMGSYCEIQI